MARQYRLELAQARATIMTTAGSPPHRAISFDDASWLEWLNGALDYHFSRQAELDMMQMHARRRRTLQDLSSDDEAATSEGEVMEPFDPTAIDRDEQPAPPRSPTSLGATVAHSPGTTSCSPRLSSTFGTSSCSRILCSPTTSGTTSCSPCLSPIDADVNVLFGDSDVASDLEGDDTMHDDAKASDRGTAEHENDSMEEEVSHAEAETCTNQCAADLPMAREAAQRGDEDRLSADDACMDNDSIRISHPCIDHPSVCECTRCALLRLLCES